MTFGDPAVASPSSGWPELPGVNLVILRFGISVANAVVRQADKIMGPSVRAYLVINGAACDRLASPVASSLTERREHLRLVVSFQSPLLAVTSARPQNARLQHSSHWRMGPSQLPNIERLRDPDIMSKPYLPLHGTTLAMHIVAREQQEIKETD